MSCLQKSCGLRKSFGPKCPKGISSKAVRSCLKGPTASEQFEVARFTGTSGSTIEGATVRRYNSSATDPTSPAPGDGDKYYNTALKEEMAFDASRGKWLSVATLTDGCGINGTTPVNTFYRRFNGMIMTLSRGPYVQKGTIVRIGFSTALPGTSHDFGIFIRPLGGPDPATPIATLSSGGAPSAETTTVNADFETGTMSFKNLATSASGATLLQATIYYKLRA